MLDRHDAPCGKAAAIANAVDFIDDGNLGIAGQQEISVQGVRRPLCNRVDRTAGGNQSLADHLAAEHALPADLRRTAAKQIHLDRLKIKDGEQILYGRAHGRPNRSVCMRGFSTVSVTLEAKLKSISPPFRWPPATGLKQDAITARSVILTTSRPGTVYCGGSKWTILTA